jgi:Tol biopolymer transport system component
LIVYREGKERMISVPGAAMMPAWSADGEWLAVVSREADTDVVYRVNVATMQPSRVLSVPEIAAPPLSNPATGRLLIAERVGLKQTAFYTVDPACAAQSAQGGCKASRKDIATVDHAVNWASYHPSATRITFSARDDGGLYLLNTANGDITPLVNDGHIKRRPAFSRDGAWLAYVADGDQLYVLHLEDMVSQMVALSKVASVDWAR